MKINSFCVDFLGLNLAEGEFVSEEFEEDEDTVGIRHELDEVGELEEHVVFEGEEEVGEDRPDCSGCVHSVSVYLVLDEGFVGLVVVFVVLRFGAGLFAQALLPGFVLLHHVLHWNFVLFPGGYGVIETGPPFSEHIHPAAARHRFRVAVVEKSAKESDHNVLSQPALSNVILSLCK